MDSGNTIFGILVVVVMYGGLLGMATWIISRNL